MISHKKPSSLPRNWPKSTEEDIQAKPQRIVHIQEEQEFSFVSNSIKTSKYEWWNFLPKFLLEEFNPRTKFANCYFLIIAGLQIIPAITNTSGYPTVLIPLFGVLTMAGVLKAMEDIERHKADRKANSSITEVLDRSTGKFKEVLWSDVQVGDFVRVKSRQTVPADMVVVQVWEPNPELPKGACYIETKSLDGETNLKFRSVLPCLIGKMITEVDLIALRGKITMEHPNNLIDNFTGVLESATYGKFPIFPNNVILRGCVLRSTDYMVGFVVNTGHDVKIMQSKIESKVKSSNLETLATKQIIGIILLLFTICIAGALGQVIFNVSMDIESFWYLKWDLSSGKTFVIKFFYMLLLHASFVPVALYVSMALVRFAQAKGMQKDVAMYYEPLDAYCAVRTMTLNEELGQVSHIFSDKTGTLTCNVMNFRKASINGVSYGKGITEIGRAAWKLLNKPVPDDVLEAEEKAALTAVPHVAFYDPEFDRDKNSSAQATKIKEFYRYIAVCHEVIPERMEDGNVKLSAPNPDDEALVCAAAYFGYEFKDRRDKIVIVHEKESNADLQVEVLYTIPFSSARKRMSVIIRDVDKKYKIITKGADTIMFPRSVPDQRLNSTTAQHLEQYCTEGLRCLVIAAKEISDEQFNVWSQHYDEANTNLGELEKKKRGELNDIETLEDFIEKELHIVGATGIEDRLQDGVPECIEKLTQASIKVWVLTGDKEETAINIAVACNLVLPTEYMEQIILNTHNAPDVSTVSQLLRQQLQRYKDDSIGEVHSSEPFKLEDIKPLRAGFKPRALIIDGPTLIHTMGDTESRNLLLLFSQCCKAVVCCRVSPDQKREIVSLVKDNVPDVRTLAVGDGANDVAMITAAHVGVGIRGEEGVQAVNASDYAIAQFRYLTPLILKHGRYNYIRMSNLICYMFYKNILMSMVMFWYNFFNAYSGLKFFTEAAIQFYNLWYTAFPILMYATNDEDLLPDTVTKYPELYRACVSNFYFSNSKFWSWVIHALFESVYCCVMTLYLLNNFDYEYGNFASFVQVGATSFFIVILVVNMKMFFIQRQWTPLAAVVMAFSILSWIIVGVVVSSTPYIDSNFFGVWTRLLESGSFWLIVFITVSTIGVKDLFFDAIGREVLFRPEHILQEMDQKTFNPSNPDNKPPSDQTKQPLDQTSDMEMVDRNNK